MRTLLILLIFALILSPDFQIAAGLPVVRLDDIIVLFSILIMFVQKIRSGKNVFTFDKLVKPLVVIACVAFFSIIFQELFFERKVVINDIMIFPMVFKYVMIYQMAKRATDEKNILFYLNVYLAVGLVSALVGVMQYHNIAGVNNWLSPIYIKDEIKVQSLIDQRLMARASGTIGDPRQFGYLLVTLMAILVTKLLEKRNTWLNLAFAAIVLAALIYTLSRTAVLVVILVASFTIFLNAFYFNKLGSTVKYSVIIIGSALFIFTYFGTAGFEERVLDTDSASYEASQYARVRDLKTPVLDVLDNPQYFFFGKGPSKAYLRSSAHSDYGLMLDRYGIIAVAAYIYLLWNAIKISVKTVRYAWSADRRIASLILAAMMLTWGVYSFAEDIFRNSQLMPINMLMLGSLSALVSIRNNKLNT